MYGKNLIFGLKTEIPGKKKLNSDHVLATTGKSCSKKKVPFSKINIRFLRNFLIGSWREVFKVLLHAPKDEFLAQSAERQLPSIDVRYCRRTTSAVLINLESHFSFEPRDPLGSQ